jgi:fucose 4-O-acetylase-like acetyltransferase
VIKPDLCRVDPILSLCGARATLTATDTREGDLRAQKRVGWVDHAKGIGIFLVVLGHVLGGLQDASILHHSVWDEFVVRFIYSFHMPLFFFIAGLFVQRSANKPISRFFLDKLSVIVYPYFVWSFLQGIIEIASAHYINHPTSALALLKIIYSPIKQYWFLYTLFIILMLYKFSYDLKLSAKIFVLFALACYLVEAFGVDIFDWNVLHSVCSDLIYFALGVVIAQTSMLDDFVNQKARWTVGIAVVGFILVAGGVAAHMDRKPLFVPELAMTGILATIAFAMVTDRSKLLSFIRTWGLLSLEIFVAHTIAAAFIRVLLQKAFGISAPLPHILFGTGVGLYVPILLAYGAQKISLPLFTFSRARTHSWLEPQSSQAGKRNSTQTQRKSR